ncbi:MAG TPA: hypothetical protein VFV99_02490 [Kofleriaceae bacterium]|nr:hypothetical protein [Kofleriaceae bacterium]
MRLTIGVAVRLASVRRLKHLVLAACLLAGCAGTPKKNERRAELAIGASLLGVIASSVAMAAVPQGKPVLIPLTITFGGLAVASAIVYGVEHAKVADEPSGPPPKPNPAWEYTKKAEAAARAGRCDEVRDLDATVLMLDADFHDVVFARDVAIKHCMEAAPAAKAKPTSKATPPPKSKHKR